jgi:hypothetical protein
MAHLTTTPLRPYLGEQLPARPSMQAVDMGRVPQVWPTHFGVTLKDVLVVITQTWPAAQVSPPASVFGTSHVMELQGAESTCHAPATQLASERPAPAQSS